MNDFTAIAMIAALLAIYWLGCLVGTRGEWRRVTRAYTQGRVDKENGHRNNQPPERRPWVLR